MEYLGSPDEERDKARFPAGLTVDALLRLSNDSARCTWALDVMNLSWNPRLIPAIHSFKDRLHERLLQLAGASHVGLTVMYRPPVGHEDRGDAYLEQIVDLARRLIDGEQHDPHQSTHPLAADAATGIEVNRQPREPGSVDLLTGLTDTADVGAQLETTLVIPLEKRMNKQLLRTHEHGYPTILAIEGQHWANPAAGA